MSWYERLSNMLRSLLPREAATYPDAGATAEYSTPSSLHLVPGVTKLRAGVVSEVGHYRDHNEDNFYVPGRGSLRNMRGGGGRGAGDGDDEPSSTIDFANSPLFLVADGMGGQQAGEHASLMAVEIIPRSLAKRLGSGDVDVKAIQAAIREAVADANREILGSSGTVTEYTNMGTTVVLALFRTDRVYVAGIGDSRAYLVRDGKIERLTKDHSLADALVEAGTITQEELHNHKFKNVLYLYLGSKDARGGPEEVRVLDIRPGDRFLLASDGLTGVVSDEFLARVLTTCEDPQQAARTLVDQALANDSKDNVTAMVIHVI